LAELNTRSFVAVGWQFRLVTCKKCGREFKSEAALKDHLRDAQVHRESHYEHKNQYGKLALAFVVLLIIVGLAIFAFRSNQVAPFQTSSTINQTKSDVALNQQLNITTSGQWLEATLNPLDKQRYNATGSITLTMCPYSLGETVCPTIEMLAMNSTGFAAYEKSGNLSAPYGVVYITATLDEQTPFTLHNPNYDGTYYFVFIATDQGNPLSSGAYATLTVYLTEVWT
jgi:hypothetical protein